MKPIDTTQQKGATGAELPPVLGLETTAPLEVIPVSSGAARKPSSQAINIIAKTIANRTRRVLLAAQSDKTKAIRPATFKP